MSPTLVGVLGLLIMLAIFLTRMPVAYVMALIGYLGFSFMVSGSAGLSLLARNVYDVFSSYGLTTIPLFILYAGVGLTVVGLFIKFHARFRPYM